MTTPTTRSCTCNPNDHSVLLVNRNYRIEPVQLHTTVPLEDIIVIIHRPIGFTPAPIANQILQYITGACVGNPIYNSTSSNDCKDILHTGLLDITAWKQKEEKQVYHFDDPKGDGRNQTQYFLQLRGKNSKRTA